MLIITRDHFTTLLFILAEASDLQIGTKLKHLINASLAYSLKKFINNFHLLGYYSKMTSFLSEGCMRVGSWLIIQL